MLPDRPAKFEKSCWLSSTRAMSLMRTSCAALPPGVLELPVTVLTMMFSNWSTSLRRPRASIVSWKTCVSGTGGTPSWPPVICVVCASTACWTSAMLRS